MKLIIVMAMVINVFVGYTKQDCDLSCPSGQDRYCGNENPPTPEECCILGTHIATLATSAAAAASQAAAFAHVAANAGAAASVAATACSIACAQVSTINVVSYGLGTMNGCCNFDARAVSTAKGYAEAASSASASVSAYANASADAAANARAAASSSSKILVQAEALINASCCAFSETLLTSLDLIADYVASAQASAEAATQVEISVNQSATTSAETAASASASSSALAQVNITNCCIAGQLRATASSSIRAAQKNINSTYVLISAFKYAWQVVNVSQKNTEKIDSGLLELTDQVQSNQCGKVALRCCEKKCNSTICVDDNESFQAINVSTKAYLSVSAVARAAARASVYAYAQLNLYVNAALSASACVSTSVNASAAINVTVTNCNQIKVTVSTTSSALTKSFSTAASSIRAIASAFSYASADALAASFAASNAYSAGLATATVFSQGCCDQPCCYPRRYPSDPTRKFDCCSIRKFIAKSFDSDGALRLSKSYATASINQPAWEAVLATVSSSTSFNSYSLLRTSLIYSTNTCSCCLTTQKPPVIVTGSGSGSG